MKSKKDISTANLIIINNKNEIFLAKRAESEKNFPWFWSIPWGTLENWDSIEETLHREIKEELDVKLGNYKFFWTYDYKISNGILCKTSYYIWEIIGNIKLEPNELSEWKRLKIDKKIL